MSILKRNKKLGREEIVKLLEEKLRNVEIELKGEMLEETIG